MSQEGQDFVVAAVIATEVPPFPKDDFTAAMIPLARQAVGDVIRNRVADGRWGNTAVEVVLAPRQFSAVCSQDYWRKALAGKWCPDHVASCLASWQNPGDTLAPSALFYYSPVSMNPPMSSPSWAAGKTEVLVDGLSRDFFRFYR